MGSLVQAHPEAQKENPEGFSFLLPFGDSLFVAGIYTHLNVSPMHGKCGGSAIFHIHRTHVIAYRQIL